MDDVKCAICGEDLLCRWSDTHGIGACTTCGLPYRLYHYENDVRVEKPPTLAIDERWLPLARQYWNEQRARVFPAAFDIGFYNRRGGRSYSGATSDEAEAFDDWMHARKAEWPVQEEPVGG